MAILKKVIGRVPVNRGEYVPGTIYYKQNIVQLYHSSFMSKEDNNTTVPATLDEHGFVVVNKAKWDIFADATNSENAAVIANNAAKNADAATSRADTATSNANTATEQANTARDNANTATSQANTARDAANKAKQDADAATEATKAATKLTETATSNANAATKRANDAVDTLDAKLANKVDEAPKDGKAYVRKDGTWNKITDELPPLTGAEELLSYGVEWDITSSDPHITRIGNPLLHKSLPVQSAYRGCVVKDGEVQYYLKADNWAKQENGNPSDLTGASGDVCVETPLFYGRSWIEGNKRRVAISLVKINESWIEIPKLYNGAYKPTVVGGKVRSVMNTTPEFRGGGNRADRDQYLEANPCRSDLGKPRTNISRGTMRNYAKAAGYELLCYEFYKWIFYWNFVIEYANFNSQDTFNGELTPEGYHQGGLGAGLTTMANWDKFNGYYPVSPCGYCNEFGNFTGVKELVLPDINEGDLVVPTQTLSVARWRGFDNPFGDTWTNLDGIVLKREAASEPSNVYTTTDVSCFDDALENKRIAGVEVPQDGYIKKFDLRETAEIIPSEVGGSASTYKCDNHWCNASYTDKRTLLVGGCAGNGAAAGVGCFGSDYSVGDAAATVGFRIVRRA